MTRRPAFWLALASLSITAGAIAWFYFPQAFSILALEISMDRERALAEARAIAGRDDLGPDGYQQAASFTLDSRAQTFVELEGGGKTALTRMLAEDLYAAYTWQVRHFREGESTEARIVFKPNGQPYELLVHLPEDLPGADLPSDAARAIAERDAAVRWHVDLSAYAALPPGQERRPGGRVDHTFTYERPSPTLGEGRLRLRLGVSGDRLTRVEHFVQIPEAFDRRYESMRAANDAIGVGSVVGLALLYVVGGIGVGLFFMLRRGWVIWRPAILWGVAVALLQVLAAVNQWPLLWMSYDTALPYSTFLLQQIAVLVATFVGMAGFFALSFTAAETLTRRAFGSHPQLWRVWSRSAGPSTTVLGGTTAGFLLVTVFLAYDVLLYLFATRTLGWWTPSESLLHPDVLATYVPWLGAIANSLQAGFWEECLFRAVPIAGAALIGDRFGRRGPFIVAAFIIQAVIFGAGHAPYPTQPSFARPVELLLPSIGFGLLYLYFGLLPAIVLHFAFDVVWFALPIFVSTAPGVWVQQAMVVVVTFVPLWIVLVRRVQAGRWMTLDPVLRNAAWTPPAAIHDPEPELRLPVYVPPPRAWTLWMALAAAGGAGALLLAVLTPASPPMTVSRGEAAAAARRAVEAANATLDPRWRVMPVPSDGLGGAHAFVYETAGEARWRDLRGRYLPVPHWTVRIATFEGDVADRAEEWQVLVRPDAEPTVRHTLPEQRPGASPDEAAVRAQAIAALRQRTGLDAGRGDVREVSARPNPLPARTDWAFVFADVTGDPLPQGERRIGVQIAGDEVVGVGRYVHVPEEWSRARRASETLSAIVQVGSTFVFGSVLVAAGMLGVLAWSRRRFAPRLFVLAGLLMFAAAGGMALNGWPAMVAALPTAQPLTLQLVGLVGAGAVSLTLLAALIGLVLGALPARLAGSRLDDRSAWRFGIAVGLFGAGVLALAHWLQTPVWADAPSLAPLGTFVPALQLALAPVPSLMTRLAVLLTFLVFVDRYTRGWTERRAAGAGLLLLVGFLGIAAPTGAGGLGWAAAGLLAGAALIVAYVSALRADLTATVPALGTIAALGLLVTAFSNPFPGAIVGGLAGAVAVAGAAWWLTGALRAARAR
jgi:hypothetical protein